MTPNPFSPNPFAKTPTRVFLRRILPVSALAFAVGVALMGFIASAVPGDSKPAGSPPVAALFQWVDTAVLTVRVPRMCVSGESRVNDFRAEQCQQFWQKLRLSWSLSLLPFFLALGVMGISLVFFRGIYHRSLTRLDDRKSLIRVTVVDRTTAERPDRYGWYFCLRSVEAVLPNHQRVRVYLAWDAQLPKIGQPLMIFPARDGRYFGILHTPHLAIVAGGRNRF